MLQNLVNAAVIGSAYVLIAIGLTMVYGLLRILHVAHAAVYVLGAFVAWKIWEAGGGLWSGLAAAAVVAGVAGVAIYEGVYRHILDRPRLVALIASVGLFVLAQGLFEQPFAFGTATRRFVPGGRLPGFRTGLLRASSDQVTLLVITVVLIVAILAVLRWTRLGLRWRAIAADHPMAAAVGIRVRRSMIANFFIGSALAGIGGVLVGMFEGRVFATMGAVPSYKAFVVVVMGGLGNVQGAIVAGYLLGLLETVIIAWVGFVLPRDAIAFLILIAFLMFRPEGLMGERT